MAKVMITLPPSVNALLANPKGGESKESCPPSQSPNPQQLLGINYILIRNYNHGKLIFALSTFYGT
jgi:hypothetical protein